MLQSCPTSGNHLRPKYLGWLGPTVRVNTIRWRPNDILVAHLRQIGSSRILNLHPFFPWIYFHLMFTVFFCLFVSQYCNLIMGHKSQGQWRAKKFKTVLISSNLIEKRHGRLSKVNHQGDGLKDNMCYCQHVLADFGKARSR